MTNCTNRTRPGHHPLGGDKKCPACSPSRKQKSGKVNKSSPLESAKPKSGPFVKHLATGVMVPAKKDNSGAIIKPAVSYEDYYASTNKKHFLSSEKRSDRENLEKFLMNPGSQFDPDKVGSLEELINKTAAERGNLEGDDRERMIAMGADPAGLLPPPNRYLLTSTGGYLGSIKSDELDDDTPVSYHEKVPGSNIVSLTVDMEEKPYVDHGVIIMTDPNTLRGTPDNISQLDSVMTTAFPGFPSGQDPARRAMSREEKEEHDAKEFIEIKKLAKTGKLTVGAIRKLKGRDFSLNVQMS